LPVKEKIKRLIEVARRAPGAENKQPDGGWWSMADL